MRILLVSITFALASCYIEPTPSPRPTPIPFPIPAPDPYCGDGICDEYIGEDAWWCVDCGNNPLTGGPNDGGFCGDGVCFGLEDMWTCWTDCHPEPWNPNFDPRDPGWIDPMPEQV
jgi:hypothetical protein